MTDKDPMDLTKSQRKLIPKLLNLRPFKGMPEVEDQSEPTRSCVLLTWPKLDNLAIQAVPIGDAQIRTLLSRLIAEIDSGANLEGRVMNLAVREGDWSKLSTGRKRQPNLPLKVGIRVVRG